MILANIFLPIILCVICKAQHISSESLNGFLNEDAMDINENTPPSELPPVKLITSNELLNRYRRYIAKTLSELSDSCQAHDFFQYLRNNMVNELPDAETLPLESNIERSHQQQYINALLALIHNKADAVPSFLVLNDGKAAAYHILMTSMYLQDDEFDDVLVSILHDKCCSNDENFNDLSICLDELPTDKRNKKSTPRKVRFHSWGGKRSENSRPQRNGRLTLPADYIKDPTQTKVVVRAPFRPWGGKRNSFI